MGEPSDSGRGWLHRLWWLLPDPVMDFAEDLWRCLSFWGGNIAHAANRTWRVFKRHVALGLLFLAVASLIFWQFFPHGEDDEALNEFWQSVLLALLAYSGVLVLVFAYNLALSGARRYTSLEARHDSARAQIERLEASVEFYKAGGGSQQSANEAGAVEVIRTHRRDESTAKIVVFPPAQVPVARHIASLFELAGWSVNLNDTPQERLNPQYVEGVEVRGHNQLAVEAVAVGLRTAGIEDVRFTVEQTSLAPDNPKKPTAIASVRVTVGHPATK